MHGNHTRTPVVDVNEIEYEESGGDDESGSSENENEDDELAVYGRKSKYLFL